MEEQAIEVIKESAISRAEELSVEEIVSRVGKVQEVQRRVMREGTHYGKVPGVDKPTLLKPGAEILGMVFRLDPQFTVTEVRDGDHLTVTVACVVYHQGSGARLGSGLGSCSTRESKYAWRKGSRRCPVCGKEGTIIKGKQEFGGGWLCFTKKGGCNQKFADGDASIESQQTDRVPNPDLYDQHNTVLKMAIKRAHVAAILFVTCASEIFTQDVEDMSISPETASVPKVPSSKIATWLDSYEKATTARHIEQTNAAVYAVHKDLNASDLDALRDARDAAKARIDSDADYERAMA